MPTSVRLDTETERELEQLARDLGTSKSEVLRRALRALGPTERSNRRRLRPYETLRHLIGRARGGPTNLSERTGEKFRSLLGKGPQDSR